MYAISTEQTWKILLMAGRGTWLRDLNTLKSSVCVCVRGTWRSNSLLLHFYIDFYWFIVLKQLKKKDFRNKNSEAAPKGPIWFRCSLSSSERQVSVFFFSTNIRGYEVQTVNNRNCGSRKKHGWLHDCVVSAQSCRSVVLMITCSNPTYCHLCHSVDDVG